MKTLLVLLLFIPIFSIGQSLRIMSYNIRYDNPKDSENNWTMRKKGFVNQIEQLHPQVFGIQEGLYHQTKYIDSNLNDYTYVGVGREDGKTEGEFAAIFYDSTKFELLKSSTFWLSETPTRPSAGWDAYHKRICTYACFNYTKLNQKFWVFNVHLDHAGKKSRKNSVKLLIRNVENMVKDDVPVFILGDFNCEPKSSPIKMMLKFYKDAYRHAINNNSQCKGTFNGFDPKLIPEKRIDYIFTKNIELKRYEHRNEFRIDGYFYSDHIPVFVDFEF